MEKLEDWFLERFIPWFMDVSRYVGVLTFYAGISYVLNYLLNLDYATTYPSLLILGFLLKFWAENSRINRRIRELIESEGSNIFGIITKDKNTIDRTVLNEIENTISQNLKKNNFYSNDNRIEIDSKITKMIFEEYRKNINKKII